MRFLLDRSVLPPKLKGHHLFWMMAFLISCWLHHPLVMPVIMPVIGMPVISRTSRISASNTAADEFFIPTDDRSSRAKSDVLPVNNRK